MGRCSNIYPEPRHTVWYRCMPYVSSNILLALRIDKIGGGRCQRGNGRCAVDTPLSWILANSKQIYLFFQCSHSPFDDSTKQMINMVHLNCKNSCVKLLKCRNVIFLNSWLLNTRATVRLSSLVVLSKRRHIPSKRLLSKTKTQWLLYPCSKSFYVACKAALIWIHERRSTGRSYGTCTRWFGHYAATMISWRRYLCFF